MSEATDQELVRLSRRGDENAFGLLVSRYERRVFAFALRRIGNHQDAEDLTVIVFNRVYQRLHHYKPEYAFSTWLFTILSNEATSLWRKRKPDLEDAPAPAPAPSPDSELLRRDAEARVWSIARDCLTEDQFSAVWLKYGEHLDLKDIATEMNRTTGSTKVLLHRARTILMQELQAQEICLEATP